MAAGAVGRRGLRRALSLVELLVVIAIIGTLVALLLPAIQAARESSRRASCASNLRQVGIALASHESLKGEFPVGAQRSITFGVSWWVFVAPYLEEGGIFARLDHKGPHCGSPSIHAQNGQLVDKVVIPILVCPSSVLPTLGPVGGRQVLMPSYVGISGATSHDGFPEDRVSVCCLPENKGEISAGGLLIPNAAVRAKQVTDGLSHTLVVGECSARALSVLSGESRIDGAFPNGWITGTTANGTPPKYHSGIAPPSWNITTTRYPINLRTYDMPGIDDNRGANNPLASEHPGGANLLWADGSVQYMAEAVSVVVLKQLSTRDDGTTVAAHE